MAQAAVGELMTPTGGSRGANDPYLGVAQVAVGELMTPTMVWHRWQDLYNEGY